MNLNPLYDKTGQHVAWQYDEYVLTPEMRYVAFISKDCVFAFSGKFVGVSYDGALHDKAGLPVLRVYDSVPVAHRPVIELSPLPPLPPLPNLPALPMMPALPQLPGKWSSQGWLQFLEGDHA